MSYMKRHFESHIDEYSDEEWNLIEPLLSEFSSISVREEFARTQLINKGLQKKISILLDPTLLICEKQWNRLINEKVADSIIPKEDYIVVYFVAKKYDSCEEYIKYLAEKYESKVIFINIYNIRKKYVDYYFRKITPFDFINLIAHAKGIITDSFHAIVYSIIYKREFYYLNNNNPKRVEGLLSLLQIKQRTVNNINDIKRLSDEPINYSEVDKFLQEQREMAEEYVKKEFT